MKVTRSILSFLTLGTLVLGATLERRAAINPVVDGNAIQVNPGQGGTYPRTTVLKDGSILAVCIFDFRLSRHRIHLPL
jgi:hypothetical protein